MFMVLGYLNNRIWIKRLEPACVRVRVIQLT